MTVIDLDTLLLLSLDGSVKERAMLGSLLRTTVASTDCWSMLVQVAGGSPSDLLIVIVSPMTEGIIPAEGPIPLHTIIHRLIGEKF